LRQVLGVGIFAVSAAALLAGFASVFAPKPLAEARQSLVQVDTAALDASVSVERVAAAQEQVLALGSRFVGSVGQKKAADLVEGAYRAAGLEVLTLEREAVAPVTRVRRIEVEAGKPLAGVEVYPFFPNGLQPMTTPPGGLKGELVVVGPETLGQRRRFDGCIAVVDGGAGVPVLGTVWANYAAAGFEAVIWTHRAGLGAVDWAGLFSDIGMVDCLPANYVRLAAGPEILKHAGARVTLRVETRYEAVADRVIVGVMRASGRGAGEGAEAVVVPAAYDAPSILPDLAPGGLAAMPLATQLAMVEGLRGYREKLKRDVVFVAGGDQTVGMGSTAALLGTLGTSLEKGAAKERMARSLAEHEVRVGYVEALQRVAVEEKFLRDGVATAEMVGKLKPEVQGFFKQQLKYVVGQVTLEMADEASRLQVVYLQHEAKEPNHVSLGEYIKLKGRHDAVSAAANLPVEQLLGAGVVAEILKGMDLRGRFAARLGELEGFHVTAVKRETQGLAVHGVFAGYGNVVVLSPEFLPGAGPERISVFMGEEVEQGGYVQYPVVDELFRRQMERIGVGERPGFGALAARNHSASVTGRVPHVLTPAMWWNKLGYPAVALVQVGRVPSYTQRVSPVDPAYARDVASVRGALAVYRRGVLAAALGDGAFVAAKRVEVPTYKGKVYMGGVGQSLIPDHPMAGALFRGKTTYAPMPGYMGSPLLLTDPYGAYSLPLYPGRVGDGPQYSPEAACYDAAGIIRYVKDEGGEAQSAFRSMNLSRFVQTRELDVNLVMFRATPVSLFGLIDPRTLSPYVNAEFLSREGLAQVKRFNLTRTDSGITALLEPDKWVYVALKTAGPGGKGRQETRAFLLGPEVGASTEVARGSAWREISGPGYLTGVTPQIDDVTAQAADAMSHVNNYRLALQQRHRLADKQTVKFQKKADGALSTLEGDKLSYTGAADVSRNALTYASLVHPILRETTWEAVMGVLWYLALLVPFAFLVERLVIGTPDVRKQVVAQAAIVLVVFLVLQQLHPAFAMIRSSLMVLLGFVILLISVGVSLLFAGKFRENLESLRANRGKITAADVNKGGLIATSLALGLNNMSRRRLRTGLTCATLTLITFALICFTGSGATVTDTSLPIGHAAYQGILIKDGNFRPIGAAQASALREQYSRRFPVVSRVMYVGVRQWYDGRVVSPAIEVMPVQGSGAQRTARARGMLALSPVDPLGRAVKVTAGRWFEQSEKSNTQPDVLLPAKMAGALGLTGDGKETVSVGGVPCRVVGIFDAEALAGLRDLDGQSILPFDAEAVQVPRVGLSGEVLAGESDPRVTPEDVVIADRPLPFPVSPEATNRRTVSIAIDLSGLNFRAARAVVDDYLEQTGRMTHYGLDGVAYEGRVARVTRTAGFAALLVPLLIAGMTVLNTMRGSVYERKDEILVYSAVGIAPRYVFLMFLAEALVYAVLGAMLGYLLSQGLGRALIALGWTGGLNMTFVSLNVVVASIAVAVAVVVSTLFPALQAARLAVPSDDLGWKLPAPEGDVLTLKLPFTFGVRDRLAVLAFIASVLRDHGEGGGGPFRASEPAFDVGEGADGAYVPLLSSTVWLKPFDLGVSQMMTVHMAADDRTGDYTATIELTRLSGAADAWLRLNRRFVLELRRHFLHWRAVDAEAREGLFEKARAAYQQVAATAGGAA